VLRKLAPTVGRFYASRTPATAEQFPGDSPQRQPIHTVYGGAHLFKADASQKLGALALRLNLAYA